MTIRSCCIGAAGGLHDFQNTDISVTGTTSGNAHIAILDTVCGSTTPTYSMILGTVANVTGHVDDVNLALPVNIGSFGSTGILKDSASELAYTQITAGVNITGTVPATPTTVITGSATVFDGNPVLLEFFTPLVITPSTAGGSLNIGLYESGSLVAQIASIITPAAANMRVPVRVAIRFTPTLGSHTYSIAAWVSSTTGTPNVAAGTGTGGANAPAYMRITKV